VDLFDTAPAVQPVLVDGARCALARLNSANCDRCRAVCPHGAVALEDRRPSIQVRRCTGCLACAAECLTGALRGAGEDPDSRKLFETPVVVIGCGAAGPAHARVRCLGALSTEQLAVLALLPAKAVRLDASACSACENGAVVALLELRLAEVSESSGESAVRLQLVYRRGELEYRPVEYSRRGFMTAVGDSVRGRIHSILANAFTTERPGAKGPPAWRSWVLTTAALAGFTAADTIAQHFVPTAVLTADCSDCLGCVGMCPTGALSAAGMQRPRLRFRAEACTRCGLCVSFCPESAIVIRKPEPVQLPAVRPPAGTEQDR